MSPSTFVDGSIEATEEGAEWMVVEVSPSTFVDGSIEASGILTSHGTSRMSPSTFVDGSIEAVPLNAVATPAPRVSVDVRRRLH